jgi:hypothetical protein
MMTTRHQTTRSSGGNDFNVLLRLQDSQGSLSLAMTEPTMLVLG